MNEESTRAAAQEAAAVLRASLDALGEHAADKQQRAYLLGAVAALEAVAYGDLDRVVDADARTFGSGEADELQRPPAG